MTDRPDPTQSSITPKFFAAIVVAILIAGGFALVQSAGAETPTIQVYKTPTCGCCTKWIDHLRAEGFDVEATDLPDLSELKATNGVSPALASCHTAMVDGYVLEGHVPAEDVKRMLAEKPKIAGLAVPGMPMGSPGMEHRDTTRHERFEVVAFGTSDPGGQRVYSTHTP